MSVRVAALLLHIPLYYPRTISTLNCSTIRTRGDLITARTTAPASFIRAAELVPGAKSLCQLIMPLFYYSRLTERAPDHRDLQDPKSEEKSSPVEHIALDDSMSPTAPSTPRPLSPS